MLPTKAALLQLISARMSWLSQRQAVLSQNIANADTPDYRPKDLRATDFSRLVEGFAGHPGTLAMAQTAPAHLEGAAVARIGLAGQSIGALAERIRAIAHDHGVPIVRNPPLARALHGAVELGVEVPAAHYRAVAEVIGYMLRLRRRS